MEQLREVKLEDLLFIDIETARNQEELVEGTPDFDAWEYKMERASEEQEFDLKEKYIEKASLYAEFSRIVCISVGRIKDGRMTVKTYVDMDEKKIVKDFIRDLDLLLKKRPTLRLCGHSIKGFDIPFIFRRCIVNGVVPNRLIDVGGLKPWEVTALDTKELWKGSGYYSASLIMLCLALSVPSPKGDITGAEVADVFFNEGEEGIERIARYCERDVIATAQCVLKMRFEDIIKESNIDFVEVTEPEPEGVIQRISRTGEITEEDREWLLDKVAGVPYKEKEISIKLVKSALAISDKEMPEDLELEMLK